MEAFLDIFQKLVICFGASIFSMIGMFFYVLIQINRGN